jgi:hypothetical protein
MATAAPNVIAREHGATAMLLIPFIAAAILLRRFYWPELAALVAIACAFALKDPVVVMARQRFVWKQEHPETAGAKRSAAIELLILAACGITLALATDWRPLVPLCLGAAAFTALAVTLNVRNRQRSEWFQVASAAALSATSLAACLAADGIPAWCWMLWLLCFLQSAAGIFVVHARLDARVALRKGKTAEHRNRRAALLCQLGLLIAAVCFFVMGRPWITGGLVVAATGYLFELQRQTNRESLQMPLKRVGLEALALSISYALAVIAGLWNG